ncbi:hypothetical protein ACFL3H_01985, partial [Gemmatimonadota bacterium]
MPRKGNASRLYGDLDLLILRILQMNEPAHGLGIIDAIHIGSDSLSMTGPFLLSLLEFLSAGRSEPIEPGASVILRDLPLPLNKTTLI